MRYLCFALVLCVTTATFAQTGPTLLVKPFADGQSVEASTSALFFGDSDVDENGGNFDLKIYDGQARWKITGEDQHNITVGYEITYLAISSSSALLPDRFVDQSVGVGFNVGRFQDWKIDAAVGVGHAGSSPYAEGRAIYYLADIIATKKLDESSNLMLFVNYNGNRSIYSDIPLPGVAYSHKVSDALSYIAGLPYSQAVWKPADQLTVTFDYFIPTTLNVRADYAILEQVTLFAAYENRLESFRLRGDSDNRRYFFQQSRVEGGVRWEPCANTSIEVAGGYAFAQKFTRGFDITTDNIVAAVDDAPYVKVAIAFGF